jgi:hypothetical protein
VARLVTHLPDLDAVIAQMLASARKFDAGKAKSDQIPRAGGPRDE